MESSLARTPAPPYTAVVFTSVARTLLMPAAYSAAAGAMEALAAQQPGYLGFEASGRGADGVGISVSYWSSPEAAYMWKHVAEHTAVQATGRTEWYRSYTVRVCTVERAYTWSDDVLAHVDAPANST